MKKLFSLKPAFFATCYLVLGLLWVATTGYFSPEATASFATWPFKNFLFVGFTASMFYLTLLYYNKAMRRHQELSRKAGEDLSYFLYRSSHDMRGPITNIQGLVYLMKKDPDPRARETYTAYIGESAMKLEKIVTNLSFLDNIMNKEIVLKEVNFNDLVKNCINKLETFPEYENVELEMTIEKESVKTDPYLMDVIFLQLIRNSIQYRKPDEGKCQIKLLVRKLKDQLFIELEDNGVGIPEHLLPNASKLFFKGSNRSTGLGLGLFETDLAVKKLSGKMMINSMVGLGTTVVIQLPDLEHANGYSNLSIPQAYLI